MTGKFLSYGITRASVGRVLRNASGARREALRVCVFVLARKLTPFVGVEHDGVRYVLSPREPTGVCYPTFVRGFFDEKAVRSMCAALAQHAGISTIEGFTVLEIGANIGTETVSLLVRHGVGHVIAIEPDPENVRFLRANLAFNDVQDRVTIYEMALSDADGVVVLEHSEDNWGDHRVRVADPFGLDLHDEGLRTTSEVPARRLDSLVDGSDIDLHRIDLVWMDAQGHEGHVLAGASCLADAAIPIVTEYWPYGLRRAGALDRFHALIADRHDMIVDLREPTVAFAADRVADLSDRYTAKAGADETVPYTDLLLLPS
jgi:FkbM family methyltransferase